MTGLFDGMAGVLNGVFGAPVSYTPQGGAARVVQSVFRERPLEFADETGRMMLITAPTWRVQRVLVPEVARDDSIVPGNGHSYQILNVHPGGSPAADAFVICELYRMPG